MAWTSSHFLSQSQRLPAMRHALSPSTPHQTQTQPRRATSRTQRKNYALLAAPAKTSVRRRERGEENSSIPADTPSHASARLRTSSQAATTKQPWTPCAALSWSLAPGRRTKSSLWPSKVNMATTACNTPTTRRPSRSSSRPCGARTEEETFFGLLHACYKISRRPRRHPHLLHLQIIFFLDVYELSFILLSL